MVIRPDGKQLPIMWDDSFMGHDYLDVKGNGEMERGITRPVTGIEFSISRCLDPLTPALSPEAGERE